ncbi:MAG TPA: hypothetical protein VHF92_16500, partial [Geodermatophilus sp.]|nr:hypothetical protein [Geodermatophilus sp.]
MGDRRTRNGAGDDRARGRFLRGRRGPQPSEDTPDAAAPERARSDEPPQHPEPPSGPVTVEQLIARGGGRTGRRR